MSRMTPLIAIHMTAAISAIVVCPFAMWARLGMKNRPKLHRAFGYAWVTLMIVTAVSALETKTIPRGRAHNPQRKLMRIPRLGLAVRDRL